MAKARIKRAVTNEPSINECFREFIQEKEAMGRSSATVKNYVKSFEHFTKYLGINTAETEMSFFSSSNIFAYINHLKKEDLSPNAINHYLRDVRTFFNWASGKDLMEPIAIKEVKAQEEGVKFFEDDDIEKLLEKPNRNDNYPTWRTWAIVNFILATGARAQTVCSVKMSDVDFKAKEIKFRHTKNKKALTVPLSKALETPLKEFIRTWRADASREDYLFANISNEPLTPDALRIAYRKYCESREVEQTNIHGLRHSFARAWIKNGGGVYQLQNILGHSDLSMTRKYVKLFGEDLKQDYEEFSALDTVKKGKSRAHAIKRTK